MSDDHGHHPEPLSDVVRRARALEELLTEKGIVSAEFIDQVVEAYAQDIGPMNGAKVVARAWVDPDYKQRLLAVPDTAARLRIESHLLRREIALVTALRALPAVDMLRRRGRGRA